MPTIQRVTINPKLIRLSPKWVSFFEYVQKHPYVKFKEIEFINGEPNMAVQVEESIKF